MITLPCTSDKCISCGNSADSFIHSYDFADFRSCRDCYEYVHSKLIPMEEFKYGMIKYYKYHGRDISPIIKRTNGEKISAVLTVPCIVHFIEIVGQDFLLKNDTEDTYTDTQYFVPVFFTEKIRNRNYANIKLYNLVDLYKENPGIIGYYEINSENYDHCPQKHKSLITKHNNYLFNLMLQYNDIAKIVINLHKITHNYLHLLPIELIHIVIKYAI